MKFKILAFATNILSFLFFFYFQFSKHDPVISKINVFGEDPFDAVGSFGIQLAFIASVIGVIRSFKADRKKISNATKVALLSVLIPLSSNILALARYLPEWYGKQGSITLIVLTFGLLLLTILLISLLKNKNTQNNKRDVKNAIGISFLSLVLLALYPESFRDGTFGGIATAIVGMMLFFTNVWAWVGQPKLRTKHLSIIILIGFLMGCGLFGIEVFGEGGVGNIANILLIASIFIGIEGLAVITGYILLSSFLL